MDLQPAKIERQGASGIVITWNDGQTRRYTARELRDGCTCASCREKLSAPAPPPSMLPVLSPAEARPLSVVGMTPVGNYAYSIEFSDGHDTGIFTMERLRELGHAAE